MLGAQGIIIREEIGSLGVKESSACRGAGVEFDGRKEGNTGGRVLFQKDTDEDNWTTGLKDPSPNGKKNIMANVNFLFAQFFFRYFQEIICVLCISRRLKLSLVQTTHGNAHPLHVKLWRGPALQKTNRKKQFNTLMEKAQRKANDSGWCFLQKKD